MNAKMINTAKNIVISNPRTHVMRSTIIVGIARIVRMAMITTKFNKAYD